jgi:tetratricopeptide (TPR) repeat protein
LAERTLFLASAGATLALGALLSLAWQAKDVAVPMRRAAGSAVAVLLALGVMRSSSRVRVWSTQEVLLEQTVVNAPRSYGAHLALARFLDDSGKASIAEPHFRRAAALNPALPDREQRLGDQFRLNGLCRPALRHYRLPLAAHPKNVVVRASSVACLLHLGRYREARAIAEWGLRDSGSRSYFERAIRTADSALALHH